MWCALRAARSACTVRYIVPLCRVSLLCITLQSGGGRTAVDAMRNDESAVCRVELYGTLNGQPFGVEREVKVRHCKAGCCIRANACGAEARWRRGQVLTC